MKKIIYYILIIFACSLFFASYWALDTYGNFTGDELFFHFLVPLGGISLQSFSKLTTDVFLPGIIIGLPIAYVIVEYIKRKKIITVAILVVTLTYGLYNIHMSTYIYNQITSSKFIEEKYIETKNVKINFPKEKKNLIYIYLESFENTYSNKENNGQQATNLIPYLTKLANDNTNFSNNNNLGGALSLNGTAWTSAAMVGQTSGLPLKINTSSNGIIDLHNFFPYSKTLGEVLKENGYNNYLLLGSDANYGCRKQYFEQHGNYKLFDLNSAIKENKMKEEDIIWWGFDDDDLFEYAKEDLIRISKNKEPFNYSILTVDTHFEDGYLADTCDNKYPDQYSNVISCADNKIKKFMNWLEKQEFYDDTVVIITGDHLSMDTDYFKNIEKDYTRTIYNVIINSDVKPKQEKNRQFTTLDMFPTTLGALGAEIEGNRLALGTNLYSNEKTIIEEHGYEYVTKELDKRSTFYNDNILAYK